MKGRPKLDEKQAHANRVGRQLALMIRDGMQQPVTNVREYYQKLAVDDFQGAAFLKELLRKYGVHQEHYQLAAHSMRQKLMKLI